MLKHRGQEGFSLIELLIVTTIIALVIIVSSDTFTIMLKQSSQTAKIVSSEIDSIIGINILRYDVEHAGYGLPWKFRTTPSTTNYEAAAAITASTYNDAPPNLPRAFVTGNNAGYNSSDYLVIKSTLAGTSDASQKWTYIIQGGTPKVWGSTKLDLITNDRVIVIKPRVDENSQNELVMDGATFFTAFNAAAFPSAFSPSLPSERFLIYGVAPVSAGETNLRMPFNRADYYIARPSANMPPSCAPNTGILYKATVNHGDGLLTEMPLLDCVADMQVVFGRDTNSDGVVDNATNNMTALALTAEQIRAQIKEVAIYILAQEGQVDTSYTHLTSSVTVGDTNASSLYFGLGSTFNLSSTIGTGWQNYRWKVHTLKIKPKQLY
jgi:prepilin-type N-terminal cleavage/methylation domain-containing protein